MVLVMATEYPSDDGYGRFLGQPSTAELERFFFLDDADRRLVNKRRGDSSRVGFALQLGTLRFLGTFLADPTDVPTEVVDYVAEQVGAADASCLKGYMRRRSTRFEHTAEIVPAYGFRDFKEAEAELEHWLDDRAWTTGDGPKASVRRGGALAAGSARPAPRGEHTEAARGPGPGRRDAAVVGGVGCAAMLTPEQARALDLLLDVPDGARSSDLDRLRKGPTMTSGKAMVAALDRVAELAALGLGSLRLDAVPQRRVVELARWGMAGKAPALRRHPYSRRLATLLATVVYLEAKATDDP